MASLKQTQIYGALRIYNGTKENSITIDPSANDGKLTFSDNIFVPDVTANYLRADISLSTPRLANIGTLEFSTDDTAKTGGRITGLKTLEFVTFNGMTNSSISGLNSLAFVGNTSFISGLKTLGFETGSTNSNSITNIHSITFDTTGGSSISNLYGLNMSSGGTISFSSLLSGTVIEDSKLSFRTIDTRSTSLCASELDIGTGALTGSTEPFRIRGSSNYVPDSSNGNVLRKDRDLRIIAPTYISSGYNISYNPNTEEYELFEKNILSVIDNTLLIKSYNTVAHSNGVAVGSSIIGYEYTEDDVASFDNEKIKIYKPLYGYSDNNANGYGGITIARDDSSESEDKDKNITLTLSPTKISFNGRNPIIIGGDGNNYGDNLNNNYKSIAIGHGATNNADKGVSIGYNAVSSLESVAVGNNASATGSNSITIGAASGSNNENTGNYSILIGNYAQPKPHSIAIGNMITNHYGSTGTTNGYNVVIGDYGRITGSYNVVVGARPQGTGTAGSEYSTSIGFGSRAYGKNAVAIGHNANAGTDDAIAIGNGAAASGSGIALGAGAVASLANGLKTLTLPSGYNATLNITTTSDRNDKINIEDVGQECIPLIKKIKPVTFRYNYRDNYRKENPDPKYLEIYGLSEYDKDEHKKASKADERTHIGFIAQDVKSALEELYPGEDKFDIVSIAGYKLPGFKENATDDEYKKYTMNYTGLIPILVKAMQEQQAEIENLKAEIARLKK